MSDSPSSTPYGKLLESWGQVVTVVTGLTVVLSLLYDWAYFSVVSPSSIQLLSIQDHISGAFEWIPAGIFPYALNSFFYAMAPSGRSVNWTELKRYSLFRTLYFYLLWLLLAFSWLFTGSSDWFFVSAILFFLILFNIVQTGARENWADRTKTFLIISAFAVTYALGQGNHQGLQDAERTLPNTLVITKDGSRIKNTVLLRQLDKGILLRTIDDNRIVFLQWDSVSRVIGASQVVQTHFRICELVGIFCSHQDQEFTDHLPKLDGND